MSENEFLNKNRDIIETFLQKSLEISEPKIFQLAGDASTRKYFRIIQNEQSWVLMFWEPFDPDQFPFLQVLQHFKKTEVQVPSVLAMDPKNGLVLLEDLGDLTLERKFWETQKIEIVFPFYEKAIHELVKMNFNATRHFDSKCPAFSLKFDTDKFMWEMDYAKKHFFKDFCKIQLSPSSEKELNREFLEICSFLDEQPKWICHRDFHSRNIMIKLGETFIIDFQDARLGPLAYDLVSLIHDSYVNLDENYEKRILDLYFNLSQPHLPPNFSSSQFERSYKIQKIQRCLKACGSFASFYNMREDLRYLKYLKPTVNKVLMQLKNLNEYPTLTKIIEDEGLNKKDMDKL